MLMVANTIMLTALAINIISRTLCVVIIKSHMSLYYARILICDFNIY